MAKFNFYQDTQVVTYVRDYYSIDADSIEEAVEIVKNADTTLDELENYDERVIWKCRDSSIMLECINETGKYSIFSEDLSIDYGDGEIINRG